MLGDLPPHSSDTRLRLDWPAYCMMARPVAVEPVKATQSTSMCCASALPALWPSPGTTFSTPGGSPATTASSATLSAVSGDFSDGLSTSELPLARIGPDLPGRHQQREIPRHDGADHPERLARDQRQRLARGGRDLVVHLVDRLPRTTGCSAPRPGCRSSGCRRWACPCRASRAAPAPRRARGSSRRTAAALSCAWRARGSPSTPLRKAARAEVTARSMSSWSPAATRARSLPVAGLMQSNVAPEAASR